MQSNQLQKLFTYKTSANQKMMMKNKKERLSQKLFLGLEHESILC